MTLAPGDVQRKALVVLLLGVAVAATYVPLASRPDARGTAAPLAQAFNALPETIGAWSSQSYDLDPGTASILRYKEGLRRFYSSEAGGIELYVFRSAAESAVILAEHPPPGCYAVNGWTILEVSPWKTRVAGREVDAKRMVAEKEGARSVVIYWEFAAPREGLSRAGDVYVVQAHAAVQRSVEETTSMLEGFLASIQPAHSS